MNTSPKRDLLIIVMDLSQRSITWKEMESFGRLACVTKFQPEAFGPGNTGGDARVHKLLRG